MNGRRPGGGRRFALAVAAGGGLTLVLAGPSPSAATPPECVRVVVGDHLDVSVDCPPPPPPVTTTTTTEPPPAATTTAVPATTTTQPPLPPPTVPPTSQPEPPSPAPAAAPPPATTTTTTTTTTTVVPPPPPLPQAPAPPAAPTEPPPAPPRLGVTATLDPPRPAPGDLVAVTIMVHNNGESAATGIALRDEVSGNAAVRSALVVGREDAGQPRSEPTASPAALVAWRGATGAPGDGDGDDCRVTTRRAECNLGSLEPGETSTVTARLLVDREPASPRLIQRISLGSGQHALVAGEDVSALLSHQPSPGLPLASLPGPSVTLVAILGLALAARANSARGS